MSREKLSDKAIGLLAEYPAPIIYGGLEISCPNTLFALQKATKLNVSLVDYYSPDQPIDILHLFGNPPCLYEICVHASKTKKVVISCVFGGATISRFQTLGIRTLSGGLGLLGQKIDYTRVLGMLESASHITSLNTIERDFIIERYKIPADKISILPTGIDKHFHTATPELFQKQYAIRDFALFTGNISKRKNPLRLASAFNKIGVNGVFIGKTVATEQAYAQEFNALIEKSPNLVWIKGLPNADPLLASAYKAASVFCLPSFAEGQSGSSLEAMAAKKPLILADLPYSYQPCYEHAVRCNPLDEESIGSAIREAMDHPNLYAYDLPPLHYWENIAKTLEGIYAKALE